MQTEAPQPLSHEEAWELGWGAFVQALEVLAEDASEQCRLMGNFNVAWELKHDVLAGESLLNDPLSRANSDQRHSLEELFRELRELPGDAVNQPNTVAGNLKAMSHPSWASARSRAKAALEMLSKHDH